MTKIYPRIPWEPTLNHGSAGTCLWFVTMLVYTNICIALQFRTSFEDEIEYSLCANVECRSLLAC